MRPFFGALLADRLHSLWLATGGSDDKQTFVIVELGAGTGVLAHDVLLRIREAWPAMYEGLLYVIGERSAGLRGLQAYMAHARRFLGACALCGHARIHACLIQRLF